VISLVENISGCVKTLSAASLSGWETISGEAKQVSMIAYQLIRQQFFCKFASHQAASFLG
jgi:hypothetical protein